MGIPAEVYERANIRATLIETVCWGIVIALVIAVLYVTQVGEEWRVVIIIAVSAVSLIFVIINVGNTITSQIHSSSEAVMASLDGQ